MCKAQLCQVRGTPALAILINYGHPSLQELGFQHVF